MDETKRIIKEYYDALPDKIKAMVVSPSVDAALKNIEKKYAMEATVAKIFENETYLILLGIEPASSFRTNLVHELGISYDQALKIAIDTNADVFGSIGELLKAIERDLIEEQTETQGSAAASEVTTTDEAPHIAEEPHDAETHPDHLIPNHEAMEKIDGAHTHTIKTPAAPVQPSIVDQKLRGLVRADREETRIKDDVEKRRTLVYKGADPYREPIE